MSLKPDFAAWMPAGPMPPSSPSPKKTMRMTWYDKQFTFNWDGYMTVEHAETDEYIEMLRWLEDNIDMIMFKPCIKRRRCEEEWYSSKHPNLMVRTKKDCRVIYFRNKEDAMAFKLRWT